MLKHGSLFSGIGGFEYAAKLMNWQNVFHCEWNKFGQQVLKYHYPKSIPYDDITKTDFTIHRGQIDVLTGGFPCQPYSQAGKRLGTEDHRHLWPEMLRAIREIQPQWVVGENVYGITNWNGGLVFNEVQVDLENEGYTVQPFIIPAAGVNAPHKRDRVWFVAYSNNNGNVRTTRKNEGTSRKKWIQKRNTIQQLNQPNSVRKFSTNSISYRNPPLQTGSGFVSNRSENNRKPKQWRKPTKRIDRLFRFSRNIANAHRFQLQRIQQYRGIKEKRTFKTKSRQSSRSICTNWKNFPTQSPICSRNDGLSSRLHGITFPKWRNESIKAYGNAIVPQVALQIFKAIQQYQNLAI